MVMQHSLWGIAIDLFWRYTVCPFIDPASETAEYTNSGGWESNFEGTLKAMLRI